MQARMTLIPGKARNPNEVVVELAGSLLMVSNCSENGDKSLK
jgi:hypothetical protein